MGDYADSMKRRTVLGTVLLILGIPGGWLWYTAGPSSPGESPDVASAARSPGAVAPASGPLQPPPDSGERSGVEEEGPVSASQGGTSDRVDGGNAAAASPPEAPVLHGRVVSSTTGAPVSPARVKWTRRDGWGISRWESREVDDRGAFRLSSSEIDDGEFAVEADGYGEEERQWADGHRSPSSPMIIQLVPHAAIVMHVHDGAGSPVQGLDVTLFPLRLGGLLIDGKRVGDGQQTDSTGLVAFDGVESAEDLAIEFHRGGRFERWPEPIRLEPSERRVLEWTWRPGLRVVGTVRDQSGEPVAHWALQLVPRDADGAESGPSCYLSYRPPTELDVRTETDGEGRFELPDVLPGSYWLGPVRRSTEHSFRPEPNWVSPIGRAIELREGDLEREFHLVAHRALYVTGIVQTSAGEVFAGATITAVCDSIEGRLETRSRKNGEFILGPMEPGAHHVRAQREDHGPLYLTPEQHEAFDRGELDIRALLLERGPTTDRVEVRPGMTGVLLVFPD